MMLMNLGFAALMSGDLRECGQRLAEGLRVARLLEFRVAQCHLIGGLGCCAAQVTRAAARRARLFRGDGNPPRRSRSHPINAGMARH